MAVGFISLVGPILSCVIDGTFVDMFTYGERSLGACFDIFVRDRRGMELRGFVIQDDLAQTEPGSWVEIEYHLVQLRLEKIGRQNPDLLRKLAANVPYSFEISGTVCARWWPEKGVFRGGDLAGRFYSICMSDETMVIPEDSLDPAQSIGGLAIGDHIHAIGLLELTVPPHKRYALSYARAGSRPAVAKLENP